MEISLDGVTATPRTIRARCPECGAGLTAWVTGGHPIISCPNIVHPSLVGVPRPGLPPVALHEPVGEPDRS